MTPDPSSAARPIRRLLVANRGELVVRIARTCRALGVRCLALVADDQREAWWATQADEQVPLNGSYLEIDAVLAAARAGGADALHPGYGFLAERPDFAEAVVEAGLTWVGPPAAAIRTVGDKAGARRLAGAVGVPLLPGYDGEDQTDATLRREADRIGYPVLVKPSAGGGGKGMHTVRSADEMANILAQARREAQAAFGDDRLVLERFLEAPRHVEVQVLFDAHGSGVHLGERDCSLQRRHQKVIEEAPAPAVGPELRERLCAAALRVAGAAGYIGAGTVEFLVAGGAFPEGRGAGRAAGYEGGRGSDAAGSGAAPSSDAAGAHGGPDPRPVDGEFFFLEMNTRLQVEHPVTELVTGRDLVADQLRVAAGGPLGLTQTEVRIEGHAFEARLYAEDPWHGFLPAGGTVVAARWPQTARTRVDAGVAVGDAIGLRYDPLLAKLIVHGSDRDRALARLRAALETTRVHGLTTNLAFLRWLTHLPEVAEGDARVDTIERRWTDHSSDAFWQTPERAWQLAARELAAQEPAARELAARGPAARELAAQEPAARELAARGPAAREIATQEPATGSLAGFRVNAPRRLRLRQGREERVVEMDDAAETPTRAPGATAGSLHAAADEAEPSGEVVCSADSETTAWVDVEGRSLPFRLAPPPDAEAAERRVGSSGEGGTSLLAPMPGTVLSVGIDAGETVEPQQTLVVIEAMKMEHAVPAPGAGRVVRVAVVPGQVVQRGELLVEIA